MLSFLRPDPHWCGFHFVKNIVIFTVAVSALVVRGSAVPLALEGGNLEVVFSDGSVIRRSQMRDGITDNPKGKLYSDPDGRFSIKESSNVVRTKTVEYRRVKFELTNTGSKVLNIARIVVLDVPAPSEAQVTSDLSGAPVVVGDTFLGVEHPLAENRIKDAKLQCALPILAPVFPGESRVLSFVLGKAGSRVQLRRAFLSYLEQERPRRYDPFLHHNTWLCVGFRTPYTESDELSVIEAFGRELVKRREVKMDGFVLDDGWDDTHSLWRFSSTWPDGLRNVHKAVNAYGAALGIWLSPWGGYSKAKDARIAAAVSEGFEMRDAGPPAGMRFSLSGPRYYARFRDLCASVVRNDGVAYFKFDGIGANSTGEINPAAGSDFEAMLRLIAELRKVRPNLYVNLTSGTWASPWWLLYVDSIWRDGLDFEFVGVGTKRQRWITYRDAETYKNVVRRSPLFPLNSVMVHGIIYGRLEPNLATDPGDDFRDEVRSFFGSGTQVQELYISPELLTEKNWDDLAASSKWARENAETLCDTHWLGGNPEKLEPYGWAAWSSKKGIITLRNPSDQPAVYSLDVGSAFELPAEAARCFAVNSPFGDTLIHVKTLMAGSPVKISLRPFEVFVIEATPVKL